MNKIVWVLFFLVSFAMNSFAGEKIEYFRKAFNGIKDSKTADAFLNTKVDDTIKSNVSAIVAYKGVCTMMKAQYVMNPFSKYSYFNQGKKILAIAIKAGKNVENIYLRLIVQLNAPAFLGYDKEIKADTEYIKNNLEGSNVPESIKKYILKNLMKTKKVDSLKALAKKYGVV